MFSDWWWFYLADSGLLAGFFGLKSVVLGAAIVPLLTRFRALLLYKKSRAVVESTTRLRSSEHFNFMRCSFPFFVERNLARARKKLENAAVVSESCPS